ncbi:PAS domain S-box protein [Cytophagaceae bacterium ABcell3]|nr:PAS domain S-box protein [Cytophagaceae bacterium ABcell3]
MAAAVQPQDFDIFNKAPDLYLFLDPKFYILNATDAYLEATLTEREKIIGRYIFDVFPDNPAAEEVQGVNNLKTSLEYTIANKRPHEMAVQRYDVRKPGGGFAMKYWKPVNTPVLDNNGNVLYILHKVEDITHSHEISAEAERRVFQKLSQKSPFAMGKLTGADYIIEIANPPFYDIWDKEASEVIGKPLFIAFPQLIKQGYKEIMDDVIQSGVPFIGKEMPIEVSDIGKNKKVIYFDMVYHPIVDPDGTVGGITVIANNVTQAVEANREVKHNENRIQQLLENLPEITWTALPSGEIVYYSQKWYDYTGMTYEETKLWGWEKVLHPDDLSSTSKIYKDAINAGKLYEKEVRLKRGSDGSYRWHLARATPLKNNQGEITQWLGTSTDIHYLKTIEAELKNAEMRLESKNQELMHINTDLDNFIYAASHDLKAPVSNMEGLLNAYIEDFDLNAEQSSIIDYLLSSVHRFKSTIKDLTEITKVQRAPEQDYERLVFQDIWSNVLPDINDLVEKYQPNIYVDFKAKDIVYSRKNLRSIIYNLVSNAIKYSSPKRKPYIQILTEQQENCIYLKVSDNGLGLSKEYQKKVFDMFKRAHQHVEGTGLGLYVVKRMVENAGGKIEVESELDKGTTFAIQLKCF